MKTYKILLMDWVSFKTRYIKKFEGTESELTDELKDMQLKAFCEDEKPYARVETFNSAKRKVRTLCAYSDSDFSYISPLNIVE